jgi:predicted transcriptional regulator
MNPNPKGEGPSRPSGTAGAPDNEWPSPISDYAYHGLAGDIVRRIEPTTEADPVTLLIHLLIYFGNVAGLNDSMGGPHIMVEDTRHAMNEFAVCVGSTAKSRKGTAKGRIDRLFGGVDATWHKRKRSGMSSGEGVIWNVRDEAFAPGGEVVDPGVPDKRLLVTESELAAVLRRLEREGSSLSAILRDAFDRVPLYSLVSERQKPAAQAEHHHISIVGHITRTELKRYLTRTEMANGLGNRFIWVLVTRSKYLPRGGRPPAMEGLVTRLGEAVDHARTVEEVDLDRDADRMWSAVYPSLSGEKPGLAGEMVARGEVHVLRLALIYALLDRDAVIRPPHLLAALAVWTYAEDSVRCIFGTDHGDADADAVLGELRAAPLGLTTEQLRNAFNRHWGSERIQRALGVLMKQGAVERVVQKPTGGRPSTLYRALASRGSSGAAYLECALSAVSDESRAWNRDEAVGQRPDTARKGGGVDETTDAPPSSRARPQEAEKWLSSGAHGASAHTTLIAPQPPEVAERPPVRSGFVDSGSSLGHGARPDPPWSFGSPTGSMPEDASASTHRPVTASHCPECGLGPFIASGFYERHRREAHDRSDERADSPLRTLAPDGGSRVDLPIEEDYPASAWDPR